MKFYINCAFEKDDAETKMKLVQEFLEKKTKLYQKPIYCIDRYGFEVGFYNNFRFLKSAENFISEITNFLKSIEVSGSDKCCLCGAPLENRTVKKIYRNGHVVLCDSACADAAVRDIEENTEAVNSMNKNYGRGIIGALIFGILGTIPWIIVYLFGYFVGWLGAIIAICAKKGYEIFGGKEGRLKAVVVILITFLSVVFAQFTGVLVEVWSACSDEGLNLGLFEMISFTFSLLLEEEEVMRYFIADLLMGFLFAAFGLWGTIRDIIHERKEITAKITVLE